MKRFTSVIVAAAAIAVAPSAALAGPAGGGGAATHGSMASPMNNGSKSTTTATPTSPTGNGGGYNHMNSPQHTTGQPMQSCETTGSPPGNSGSAPGSAFNEDGGTAGGKYAGEQPQNSRNTASTSQYDVACAIQPH